MVDLCETIYITSYSQSTLVNKMQAFFMQCMNYCFSVNISKVVCILTQSFIKRLSSLLVIVLLHMP